MGIGGRLAHAWNAFTDSGDEYRRGPTDAGVGYSSSPSQVRTFVGNERSILASIICRIAIDASMIQLRHVRLDDSNRYKEDMDTGLQECLTVEANVDQSAYHFNRDLVISLLTKGTIAVAPIDTTENPGITASFDVKSLRISDPVQYFPRHIRVEAYNDRRGVREQLVFPKNRLPVVENPLHLIMNEPNSTLQRLIRTLNNLDKADEIASSGKLDMIIQLPYTVRTETRRQQAEQRRKDIEFQLKGSQYGIAYTDGTEKITQLNRAVENNLLAQVKYLKELLYEQTGITETVLNGTADEATMLNYMSRTVEPIVEAIRSEYRRKFLSRTARSQKQSIEYFMNLFKLVPMKDLAEMADKFTRNEIVTSNEFRGFLGMKPSTDPKADQLINANMPQGVEAGAPAELEAPAEEVDDEETTGMFDEINKTLDGVFADFNIKE